MLNIFRINPEVEPDLIDGVICNPAATSSPQSQILKDVYEKRRQDKRKNCDNSEHCSKRQKLSTSTESLNTGDELSAECKLFAFLSFKQWKKVSRQDIKVTNWQNLQKDGHWDKAHQNPQDDIFTQKRLRSVTVCAALQSDLCSPYPCPEESLDPCWLIKDLDQTMWMGRLIWATSWENLFMPYANNKGTDQPAHLCSLISTFVVRCLDSIIPVLAKSKISRP